MEYLLIGNTLILIAILIRVFSSKTEIVEDKDSIETLIASNGKLASQLVALRKDKVLAEAKLETEKERAENYKKKVADKDSLIKILRDNANKAKNLLK